MLTDSELLALGRRVYENSLKDDRRRCKLCLGTDALPGFEVCVYCCRHDLAEYQDHGYGEGSHVCKTCGKEVEPKDYDLVRKVQDGQDT